MKSFIDPKKNSALARGVLCDERTELIDSVISSGNLGIHPLIVAPGSDPLTDAHLSTAILALAAELIEYHANEQADGLAFTTTVVSFDDEQITAAAGIMSREVYDYTDTDGEETSRIAGDLKKILKPTGATEANAKVVSARAVYNDEEEGDERHVTVTLFVNTKNGKAVVLYMVEGRM